MDTTKTCTDSTCSFYSPNGNSYGSHCTCVVCIKNETNMLEYLEVKNVEKFLMSESFEISLDSSFEEICEYVAPFMTGKIEDCPVDLDDFVEIGCWDIIKGDGLNFPGDSMIVTEYDKQTENGKFYFTVEISKDDNSETYYKETDTDMNLENWDLYAFVLGTICCSVSFKDDSYISLDGNDQNSFNFKLSENNEPKEGTIAFTITEHLTDMEPIDVDYLIEQWENSLD